MARMCALQGAPSHLELMVPWDAEVEVAGRAVMMELEGLGLL